MGRPPSFAGVGPMRRSLLVLVLLTAAATLWRFSRTEASPLQAEALVTPRSAPAQVRSLPEGAVAPVLADTFYPGFDSRRDKLPKFVTDLGA